MIFKEDSRVKLTVILHFMQLGYKYISLNFNNKLYIVTELLYEKDRCFTIPNINSIINWQEVSIRYYKRSKRKQNIQYIGQRYAKYVGGGVKIKILNTN